MTSKGNGKFVLGALLGVAAGAVGGLLFAPKSGKETRKGIADKTKEYAQKGKEMATDCIDKSKSFAEKGENIAKEKVRATAQKIADQMETKK